MTAHLTNLRRFNILSSPSIVIAIILFSFNFKISNTHRWVTFSLCLLLMLLRPLSSFWKQKKTLAYFGITPLFSWLIFQKNPERALQFLSYGYDNAFQFSAFLGFNRTSWYPSVDFENWFTNFELFKNVPMGHSAAMSFILHPLTFISVKTEDLIIYYAAFQIFSIFLLFFLVDRTLNLSFGSKDKSQRFLRKLFSILAVTCIATTLLINGFAPYFWSLVLILFWINYDSNNGFAWHRNLTLSLCIYSISQVTPAPATLLFFPAMVFVIREFRLAAVTSEIGEFLKNISPFILVGALVLYSFHNSSAGLGWRQLLQAGGLQNIKISTTLALFLFTFSFLISNRFSLLNDPLALVVISGFVSSIAFSFLTIILTGNLQYYAIKHIYLTLFFSAIYVAKILSSDRAKFFLSCLFVSLLIYPIIFPTFYTAGYMGVFPNVIVNTFSKSNWGTDPVNAEIIIQKADALENTKNECFVWRAKDPFTDKDLSSRWLNALYSKSIISETCFSAYWNNGALSDVELIRKLENLAGDFVIFTEIPFSSGLNQKIKFVKIT